MSGRNLFMVAEDNAVLAIGTMAQIAERYEFGDVHDTFGEPLFEQDFRAARLRALGLDVADIADAMGASEYRVRRMLMRVDSGRWSE